MAMYGGGVGYMGTDSPRPRVQGQIAHSTVDDKPQRTSLASENHTHDPATSSRSGDAKGQHVDATNSYTPPKEKCTHWNEERPPGEPLLTCVMAGNIKNVWQTFFNDDPDNDVWHMHMMRDPGLQAYIKEYKRYPWGPSKKGCCMERMLYFISPPQDLPLVGNIKVPVKQFHHIYQPSGKVVMYKTRAFASEAPYSDAFVVDTRWVFEQLDEDKVRMRVFMDIIFIKSCWVKTVVRNAAAPPANEATLAVAKILEACSSQLVEVESTLGKGRPAGAKALLRKMSLAQVLEQQVTKKDATAEGADAQATGHARTMAELAPLRTLTWAEMPFGWRWATVLAMALAAMFFLMYIRVMSIEAQNVRLQREISLLGPVLSHTVLHSEKASRLWDELPNTLVSKETADIINNLDKTLELVSVYQGKIDTLNLLLNDYNEQYAVPSWVWYMLLGCFVALPISLAQGGKLDTEKLLSRLGSWRDAR